MNRIEMEPVETAREITAPLQIMTKIVLFGKLFSADSKHSFRLMTVKTAEVNIIEDEMFR